jgi:Domain of unknown function (DUF1844)
MAEEEKGFVIRDRRGRGSDTSEAPASTSEEPTAERAQKTHAEERLPPSFVSFVYSLGTSALMLLGEGPKQEGSGSPQSLAHAQEIIDVLSILETKTKGNLAPEEETLLQEMLYTLRIKYVEKASSLTP